MSARLAQKNAQAVAAIQALCAHKAALLDTLAGTTSPSTLAGASASGPGLGPGGRVAPVPGPGGVGPVGGAPSDSLSSLNRTFANTFDTADIQWW